RAHSLPHLSPRRSKLGFGQLPQSRQADLPTSPPMQRSQTTRPVLQNEDRLFQLAWTRSVRFMGSKPRQLSPSVSAVASPSRERPRATGNRRKAGRSLPRGQRQKLDSGSIHAARGAKVPPMFLHFLALGNIPP